MDRITEDRVYEIAAYIAIDSLNEAEKWGDRIYHAVERLAEFPESGRQIPELSSLKNYRELIFGNYRIIYRINTDTVFILTVRNYKQILPLDEIG